MKNSKVKVGLLVEMKADFYTYAKAGDICEVLQVESDGSHLLKNTRTGKLFCRSSWAYRKVQVNKGGKL